jgi:hypothetical protein
MRMDGRDGHLPVALLVIVLLVNRLPSARYGGSVAY